MTKKQTKTYLYEALGRMVVSFQGLEREVEGLIFGSMTSSYSQVRILMSEMSFKAKVNIMNALIKDLHNADEQMGDINIYTTIEEITKKCQECEAKRNQLVHSFWIPEFSSAPDLVMRIKESSKTKKGYHESIETIKHGSLDDNIKYIDQTGEDIYNFSIKLSTRFNRIHGIPGMEGTINHTMLVDTIYNSFLKKYKKDIAESSE